MDNPASRVNSNHHGDDPDPNPDPDPDVLLKETIDLRKKQQRLKTEKRALEGQVTKLKTAREESNSALEDNAALLHSASAELAQVKQEKQELEISKNSLESQRCETMMEVERLQKEVGGQSSQIAVLKEDESKQLDVIARHEKEIAKLTDDVRSLTARNEQLLSESTSTKQRAEEEEHNVEHLEIVLGKEEEKAAECKEDLKMLQEKNSALKTDLSESAKAQRKAEADAKRLQEECGTSRDDLRVSKERMTDLEESDKKSAEEKTALTETVAELTEKLEQSEVKTIDEHEIMRETQKKYDGILKKWSQGKNENEELRNDLAAANESRAKLEVDKRQEMKKASDFSKEKNELQHQLKAIKEEKETLQKKFTETNTEREEAQEDIATLKGQLTETAQGSEKKVAELEGKVRDALEASDGLASSVSAQTDGLGQLKEKLQETENALQQHRICEEKMRGEVGQLTIGMNEKDRCLKNCNSELVKLKQQVINREVKEREWKEKHDVLGLVNINLRAKVAELQEDIFATTRALQLSKSEATDALAKLTTTKQQLNDSKAESCKLKGQLELETLSLSSTQQKLKAITEAERYATEKLENCQQENEEQRKQLDELKAERDSVQSQLSEARFKTAANKSELDDFNAKIEQLEKEKTALNERVQQLEDHDKELQRALTQSTNDFNQQKRKFVEADVDRESAEKRRRQREEELREKAKQLEDLLKECSRLESRLGTREVEVVELTAELDEHKSKMEEQHRKYDAKFAEHQAAVEKTTQAAAEGEQVQAKVTDLQERLTKQAAEIQEVKKEKKQLLEQTDKWKEEFKQEKQLHKDAVVSADRFRAKCDCLIAKLDSREDTTNSYRQQLTTLKINLSNAEEKVKEQNRKLEEKEETLADLKKKILDCELASIKKADEFSSLRVELHEARSRVAQLEQQQKDLEKRAVCCKQQLATVQTALVAEKKKSTDKEKDHNRIQSNLQNRVEQLQGKYAAETDDHRRVREELEDLKQKLDSSAVVAGTLQHDLTQAKIDNEALTERLDADNKTTSKLRQDKNASAESLAKEMAKAENLEIALQHARKHEEAQKEMVDRLRNDLHHAQRELKSTQDQRGELLTKLDNAQRRITEVEGQLRSCKEKLEKITQVKNEHQTNLNKERKETENLQKRIKGYENELASKDQHIEKLGTDKDQLKQGNVGLAAKLQRTERELAVQGGKMKQAELKIAAVNDWIHSCDPFTCVVPQELYNDERIHKVFTAVLEQSSLADLPVRMVSKPSSSIGPEDEGRVVVPVVGASRAHSDITAALCKAKLKNVKAIILVFQPTPPHQFRDRLVPSRDKTALAPIADQNQAMIDIVYHEGAMIPSSTNTEACRMLKECWSAAVPYRKVCQIAQAFKEC